MSNITHEMIEAAQRKESMLKALEQMFDARIEQIRNARDSKPEHVQKARGMKAAFILAASVQPPEFFAGLRDVNAALVAIKPLAGA